MSTLKVSALSGDALAPAGVYPARRLRVLHLNAGNLYGGVETLLTALAQLSELCPGMESHFAVCQEGRFSRELQAAGVAVNMLGKVRISQPWTVWRARRRLREVLGATPFDLVICHMPWSLVVFGPAVRGAGCKVGFWAHNFHTGTAWVERLAGRVRPDLAIATSRFVESGLDNLWRQARHSVLYPPVPLAPLRHSSPSRSVLRKQLGVADDTVVIIQVGRLERYKGHLLHLEALSKLREQDDWACWVVGGPQKPEEDRYLDELKQTASQFGLQDKVRFLGQRSDVSSLLAAADIFCQPNRDPEPFGIVFVEALWAGLPVVSTALGGALEIVDDTCGLLAPPADAGSLADCLRSLIQSEDFRRRLGQAGAKRAAQLCDPAQQIRTLDQLVRQADWSITTA